MFREISTREKQRTEIYTRKRTRASTRDEDVLYRHHSGRAFTPAGTVVILFARQVKVQGTDLDDHEDICKYQE
jgi:hypothetical protein